MQQVTPEKILDLAKENPVVNMAVALWRDGHVTWEKAMMFCVLVLADSIEKLQEDLIQEIQRKPFITTCTCGIGPPAHSGHAEHFPLRTHTN